MNCEFGHTAIKFDRITPDVQPPLEQSKTSGSRTRIPKSVVRRLSAYLRELQSLEPQGTETVSSSQLARRLGWTDAQVRKDFAFFGQFGHPGVGYRCSQLIGEIRRILATDQQWPVVLVGCGNLGQALVGYRGFANQGFVIIKALDIDPEVVGQQVGGLTVGSFERLESELAGSGIHIGIVAVPSASAQGVAERLVAAGVTGILNFAPIKLNLPPSAHVIDVDLAMELEQLSYAVVNERRND